MKFIKIFTEPWKTIFYIQSRCPVKIVPDRLFIKCAYRIHFGKPLNLNNPITYNEKLQWLKLYDRQKRYTTLVDKYAVRNYIENKLGKDYLVPLYGVWDSFDEIDFSELPNQFVLKCTHDSGGLVIVRDKALLNINSVREKLNHSLHTNYYLKGREWPYKNVKPRIICEQLLANDYESIKDYKVFCFNGTARFTLVCSNRFSDIGLCEDFYDNNWSHLDMKRPGVPNSYEDQRKPINFLKMIEIAELLSKGIPFLRVDFYEINDQLFIGELTLYPASGFEGFEPQELDTYYGSLLKI